MKKPLKVFLSIVAIFTLIALAALAYLNFVYLPQKVKAQAPAFLEEKSKGRLKAESIQYIPLKGIKVERLSLLSPTRQPLFTLDKLYVNAQLWPLLLRKELVFRADLYPVGRQTPLVLRGMYQFRERHLDTNFALNTDLFLPAQTVAGKAQAAIDIDGNSELELTLSSPEVNVRANVSIKDKNLYIQQLSAGILGSTFDFIGDIQNLSAPVLNIYGTLELNLAGLHKLNPAYCKLADQMALGGTCSGEMFIASRMNNPQIGLKLRAPQLMLEQTEVKDLSIVLAMENKQVRLAKFYAKLCEGEVNFQGDCRLDSDNLAATLSINIFNVGLHQLIKDAIGKDTPVQGRLFSLGRLAAPLKDPQAVEGNIWLSASGTNILQFPLFQEIANILRLPELQKARFKEAAGNFAVAKQAIRTEDLKLTSESVVINFSGYMDFKGDLAFDIRPNFSQGFLAATPNIGNILGILADSAGNFLGEIKLKGNIRQPRYTFKPITAEKLFPAGLEEGLKQLFKFK